MKDMINKSVIEGRLYESTVEEYENKNTNSKYVSGKISIETEENNVVVVEIYENEITRKGKRNQKYDKLLSLKEANSIVNSGRENAIFLSISSSLSVNDWYPDGENLVTTLRNFNGFINFISEGECSPRATFQTDMLITNTMDDMDRNDDGDFEPNGKLKVKGYIFDYQGKIMPAEFLVENPDGVEYFRSLEPNTFTKVWGRQESITETIRRVEESAFGEDKVTEFTRTSKAFIITGTNKEPYPEEMLTTEEIQKAIADRNTYLADKKAKASQPKSNAPATDSQASVVTNPTEAMFTF